ncbi:hypothetical protein GW932_04025 [archaeon]|nr:hypothetical protein [archaeon]
MEKIKYYLKESFQEFSNLYLIGAISIGILIGIDKCAYNSEKNKQEEKHTIIYENQDFNHTKNIETLF